jgi:protein-S-isoprenylcysteine O-methyltransferase Ste14
MGWNQLLILFAVALVLCAVGFYKYVYFLSIGYGFAVAGIGAALMILFGKQMQAVHICPVYPVPPLRRAAVGLFGRARDEERRLPQDDEGGHEGRKGHVRLRQGRDLDLRLGALCGADQPVFFRQYNAASDAVLPWIGAAVSACAILLEALADRQKSEQKKQNPNMVATKGLYKIVRCPNYCAEILFWTGVFAGGLTALRGAGQWSMAVIGYVCIIGIMFNGAKRLETRQLARYGKLPEYRSYADRTPILLPLIPLYHLAKEK